MPNSRFRLAAIDLDETLLGPDKAISPENAKAVQLLLDGGVQVILASGRRYENMARYAAQLGLSGPMITCQGALAEVIGSRERLYECCLEPQHAKQVLAEGRARDLTMLVYHPDATYANRRDSLVDLYEARSGDCGVVIRDLDGLGGPFMKIIWLAAPAQIPALARWAAKHLDEVHSVATDPEYLELMNRGANKAEALEAVATYLGVPRDKILAFGDGNNDAEMLRWAGVGIAMDHGAASAHAAADAISPAGDPETALARVIDALWKRNH